MNAFWQDLIFEMRLLRKSPVTVAVAALTLSLGIGANTAVFSLIKALILRPLPGVERAENLVVAASRTRSGQFIPLSYPNYRDLRDQNRVFSALAASAVAPISCSINGAPARRQWAELVSGNYFEMLGVKPALGRPITVADNQAPGQSPVVVLSDSFWRRAFNADPKAVGSKLILNGHPFEIVGVAPQGFAGSLVGLSMDLYVPVMMQAQAFPFESGPDQALDQRNTQWLVAQGRLKSGVSMREAQAAMAVLGAQLLQAYPNDQIADRAVLFPLWRSPFGAQSYLLPAVSMLVIVGILVLLVACANVANVLLALAVRRSGEMAMRMALGAGRVRLIRQLLTGSLLVSLLGGALGLAGASQAANLLRSAPAPVDYPIALNTGIDQTVFLFSLLLAALVGMLMGVVPALRISRVNLIGVLRSEASAQIRRRTWAGSAILATQVAVSLVLLLVAGAVIRNLLRFRDINPGFDAHHVLLAGLDLTSGGYDAVATDRFVKQALREIEATPGVTAASAAWQPPLAGKTAPSTEVGVEGYQPQHDENMIFNYNAVGPKYLSSLDIKLVEGRDIGASDDSHTPHVAVINQTMARRFWPGQSPVGRKITAAGQQWQVIGVAADSKYLMVSETAQPYVYLPFLQIARPEITLQVRGQGSPRALEQPVRDVIQRLDSGLALLHVKTLDQQVSSSMFGFEAIAGLLGTAGLLALLLAAVGVYGVAAQGVAQRLPEIGLRMALGASPSHILRMVLASVSRQTLAGATLGLILALGATQLMRRIFTGVDGLDAKTFCEVAAFFGLIVLAASWAPASRAARLQPSSILKER